MHIDKNEIAQRLKAKRASIMDKSGKDMLVLSACSDIDEKRLEAEMYDAAADVVKKQIPVSIARSHI